MIRRFLEIAMLVEHREDHCELRVLDHDVRLGCRFAVGRGPCR
jgi:hypothetical protein